MKIQTQFHLLIAGILVVPVLMIISQVMYRNFETGHEDLSVYEDIAAMMDSGMDIENREKLSRFLYGMTRFGNIAIFDKKFTVIHSTIPEFSAGAVPSVKEIIAMLGRHDGRYAYSLESPHMVGSGGYILIRRDTSPSRKNRFGPFLYTALMVLGLFLFLVVFAIIMSLLIARSITKSVMVLENATRRIAAGELDLEVDVKGSNEITSLTNSLNKMRGALKEEERRRYRFIMGVTHDLKTPLALIKAYAEAIEDGIAEDPATGASATEIINAKVDQLEGMIGDLIEFVRMDTGEWRGRLKTVNLSAFLRQSAKAFTTDAELLRHIFQFHISLPDTVPVPMDERLVQRTLENIVNNAIRYTPAGSLISLDAAAAGNAVILTISDNGPGIKPADLPHIFEMFYRGSSSRREQGMGLGLAVAKWVADCHGWTISASPAGEQGTCFTITIPLNHAGT
ncbi:MAG: HAMP domain-containing histidine kinase [Spirochaetaceae bacterium]|jgi:signal transduction histidine kinase|nr:HAMP domain-containing histidine kinase [Spirochaetaceae bacterium]